MRNSKKFTELFMPKLKGSYLMTCKGSKLIHPYLQSNHPIVTQLIKRVNLHIITTHSDWQKGLHYLFTAIVDVMIGIHLVVLQADSESSEPSAAMEIPHFLKLLTIISLFLPDLRSQDSPTHFISMIRLSPAVNFPLGYPSRLS